MGVNGRHNGRECICANSNWWQGSASGQPSPTGGAAEDEGRIYNGGDATETKLIRELLKSFSMGGCSEKGKTVSFYFEKISTFGSNSVFLIGKALSFDQ